MSSSWPKVLSSSAAMSSIYFSNPRKEITGGWEKCSAALTFCRARGDFELGEREEGREWAPYGSRRLGEGGGAVSRGAARRLARRAVRAPRRVGRRRPHNRRRQKSGRRSRRIAPISPNRHRSRP